MKKLILLALFFFSLKTFAQIVPPSTVTGNNPVDIHWKYMETKAVKVIYPEGNQAEATRVANIINYIYDSAAVTVGPKRKHLDLLLQTNQVISNGYVGLSPYRSEFYATGIQNLNWLGSVSWLDGLAFHEYRHALQFINGRRGLTKFLYYFGGQNMWAFAINVSVPNWYFEGDAVQTETMFSGAGRGRTPYFFQEQRALLLNGRKYPYIKARNGSFRSMMPDHYRLGYAMLHQVRSEHGPEVWSKILRDAGAYKGVFYPFSQAMNRHTGNGTRRTYYRTYDTLQTTWEKELEGIDLIATERFSRTPKRIVTNYEWPHYLADSSIICRKESYNKTAEVVHLTTDGGEKHLTNIGFTVTESFLSVNDNVVAWTELTTNPRWLNRNYSDIHTYNLTTKEKRRIESHTKWFAPHYSAKKNLLVAVQADEHLKNSIVFIDPQTGEVTASIPNPQNDFLSYPKWTKDASAIVYLVKRNSHVMMVKYDLNTKVTTELTPLSQQVIEGISLGENHAYFTASYSGINNVYAVNLNGNKEIRQISSVKIGANNPGISADEKTLALSELGIMGTAIYTQPVDLAQSPAVTVVEPELQTRYKILTTPVESSIYNRIPNAKYEEKNYKGPIRSPKLHSWNITGNQREVALTVHINNILNDFGAVLKAGKNLNENTAIFTGTVDFAKYYLPIGLNASVNGRNLIAPKNNLADETDTTNGSTSIKFTEAIYSGGLSLPLTWYNGIYSTRLRAYANAGLIHTSQYKLNDSIDLPTEHDFSVVEAGLDFANLRGRARQNIYTRFGQELSVYYGGTTNSNKAVLKFQVQGALYLPGFMRNHGFKLEGGYKEENLSNDYRYLDNFQHARGYTPIQGDQEFIYAVNYALPLCYPDFGFGGLVYLKRIRANVFADFSQVTRTALNKTFDQNSAGVEFYFDTVVINIIPLSIGARYTSLMNTNYYNHSQSSTFNFFLGTSF